MTGGRFGACRFNPASPRSLPVYIVLALLYSILRSCSSFVIKSSPQKNLRTATSIMGIKGFRSWLESQFPESVTAMPLEGSSETFDVVMIDMNQLLHVAVRKSRSDGHGLTLLMKELDACLQFAKPTKALVLAMDGPPSAAKLATQRKRRLSTVLKAENKLRQLEKIKSSPTASRRTSPKVLARKKRLAASETRTLHITPATDFMFTAEQALLYWVWQRLSARYSTLSSNNVKVYISPSTVAGEGEVKLLEWIYSKHCRKGESIAILGGDSDLVLEGLVIPTASTHNVFILLPEGSRRYLSVSLWEITRSLQRLLPHLTIDTMMKVRTDLALLLILNGNDYLPKLRGSSGFNKLFHSYLRIQRSWKKQGKEDQAYLVEPDTLDFNLDFCIDYFGRLASFAPTNLWSKDQIPVSEENERTTPLQQLNTFCDAGYLPQPISFRVVGDDDDDDESIESIKREEDEFVDDPDDFSEDDDLSDDENEDVEEEQMRVRLLLGQPGSEDFYAYEIWCPKSSPMKAARQRLAAMAVKDLLDEEDALQDDDEDFFEYPGIAKGGYDWELKQAVEAKTDDYLYGLLWTLQTYQDGICSDYSFNYGKRQSPLAKDIVDFFGNAKRDGTSAGLRSLSKGPFRPPITAGVSCLAALPAAAKHLVPAPYKWLPDEKVESIYANCVDKENNVFDMKMFEKLCEEAIDALAASPNGKDIDGMHEEHNGRRILMGDHYWTVISKVQKPLLHPFDPPAPFSDRLSHLRQNPRIRVSRKLACVEPRQRSAWNGKPKQHSHREGFVNKDPKETIRSEPGVHLQMQESIMKVEYKKAYESRRPKKRKGLKKDRSKAKDAARTNSVEISEKAPPSLVCDTTQRMKQFQLKLPPPEPSRTRDGVTAMACLKQLEDTGFIGRIQWKTTTPSKSEYASFDPKNHELIALVIGRDAKKSVLSKDLEFEQDREVNYTSRQLLKHYLSSLALCDIAGPKWTRLSFNELKSLLSHRVTAPK